MRIKLKGQLFLGISLAIFLVLVLGILSFVTSRKEREAERWINHTFKVKATLQDINIGLKDNAASVRAGRRYKDLGILYKKEDSNKVTKALHELQELVKDNEGQLALSKKLETEIGGLYRIWSQINPEETRNDAAKEEAFFIKEVNQLKVIGNLSRKMDTEESALLVQRRAKTLRLLDINDLSNIGGTILILFVVILLSLIINREFKMRKKAELKLNDNIDELEQLNTKTALHNEVLSGAQSLLEQCQKATDVAAFLKATLDGILNFTGLSAGAVFLTADEQKGTLVPVYQRGISGENIAATNFQSLLAAIPATQQSVVVVQDIPARFWMLQSASGSTKPGVLVYIFIRLQQRVLGVIELAGFQPLSKKQEEFINMLGNALGIRLSALQLTENRNHLLLELQEKQDILINQQEELRQANDELTQQTQVLQASEEELRVQEEELKQINAELEEKSIAVESARQVMAVKAAELEQSGKYKSEFLANMSHELRTPLNSVLILANLLRDNKEHNLTAKQVEYAKIIANSGNDLLKLINDILDLSKIEAGKIDLDIESVPVASITEDMRQLFFAPAEEKKINFRISKAAGLPEFIVTDRQRLQQVIKNLLSNAIKFTPEAGTVTLEVNEGIRGTLSFVVTDTGIGIEPDKQELIFEAFKQADGSTNRKYGGTGLGLSISRELAKMLGGNIKVDSQPGKGSQFSFSIPLEIDGPAMAMPESIVLPAVAHKVLPEDIGRNRTVLIIEDDANFAAILKDFAEERFYQTLVAGDGKQGLEMARTHKPDAVILDLQMPVMDGWDVLKEMRNDAQLKHIPVHIISAMDEAKFPMQGSVAYIKKPVSKEDLEKTFLHIGNHLRSEPRKLLILSSNSDTDETLNKFISELPEGVQYDITANISGFISTHHVEDYDCIIADTEFSSDDRKEELKVIKEHPVLSKVSLILLIDREISPSEELRLRGMSEAIVMKSMEAHRRLIDELELFMFRIKEEPLPFVAERQQPFTNNDILVGKTVLVADDDMRNVFALVSLLENQQMEVVTASNGKEAIDILEQGNKVDIILMDIMMPEMDGYEAMRYLRSRNAFKKTPIIALTAKAMAEDKELCIKAGASDYMSKPVDTPKLLSLLRIWLS